MQCFRCGRAATMLVGNPASPMQQLCPNCSNVYPDGLDGNAEAEPHEPKAGKVHRKGIEKNFAEHGHNVMTTSSFGMTESKVGR